MLATVPVLVTVLGKDDAVAPVKLPFEGGGIFLLPWARWSRKARHGGFGSSQ